VGVADRFGSGCAPRSTSTEYLASACAQSTSERKRSESSRAEEQLARSLWGAYGASPALFHFAGGQNL
jgi:hypothetical protein